MLVMNVLPFCYPIYLITLFTLVYIIDFSSWCMLELMFAIYHRATEYCHHTQQASYVIVSLVLGIGTVNSGISFAALCEESLTWASVLSQTFYR